MKRKKPAQRPQSEHKLTTPKGNKPAPKVSPPESRALGAGEAATAKPQSTAGGNWLEAWERRKAELDSLAKEVPGKACDAIPGRELSLALFALSKVIEHHGYDMHSHSGPAMSGLLHHADEFLKEVEKVARDGSPEAQSFVWRTASRLCWLVEEIARTKPEDLQGVARTSMFMPSLRALPPKFMADWESVADKLELSKGCVVNMRKEAQHELHSPFTLFVARWLERTNRTRRRIADASSRWERFRQRKPNYRIIGPPIEGLVNGWRLIEASPPDPKIATYPIQSLNQGDFIQAACHLQDWERRYPELPMLYNRETWREWWEKGLKPYIDSGPALENIHGTRIYTALLKATDNGKDYDLRDELKRRCKPKLESLAPSVEYSRQVSELACHTPTLM